MPSYEELRVYGVCIDCGASLHCWHEDYLYKGKKYRASGALCTDETVIEEIYG